ncbi:kinesin light chain 3 isoform X2 [Neltuma alba]|uniref:kinesin light chain 3 isoform X2 n=1 Tax=Neltuma alba TaxID=207710 RepID=UPI0010A2FCE5|nr:kinesin light chain 3-like isoform X2 [Prosopis alba]
MSLRVVAANLLKKIRFPSRSASSTSVVTSNALPISLPGENFTCHWHRPGAHGWRTCSRGPCLWTVIYGHLALIIGINANPVFAKDASKEAVLDSDAEKDDITGLQKIEDGSVVSNIHTSKWRVFTDKGREFFLEGKIDEAEKLFLSAVQEAREGFGQRDPHVASACNNLAELYRVKKAFDKAEPLYLEAISILEESFGPEDIRVGAAAHNLGQFFLGQRKLEEARVYYAMALKIKRRVLGYNHPDCSDTMYHLGVVLYLQGKEGDAEAFIQDSIRMLEEGGEGESSICIRRLRYLSQIYMKSHRYAEAEMIQRKILHNMELSKGWNSLDTIAVAEGLALTLQASNNLKASQELLQRCLDARKVILPHDHIQIGANLLHLARGVVLNSSQLHKWDASGEAELDRAKEHLNNSIRIARQVLNKLLKQKVNTKDYGVLGRSTKERQVALIILLQSLSTLASLELAKQGLLETQEEHANREARKALVQCVSAYREYVSEKSVADSPEIKKEYLSCLKRAQDFLDGKFAEEPTN